MPDPQRLLRFLDNHDTDRFILTEPDSLDSWKQAVTMLLTVPGIPQLYYGTELLMSGDRKPGDGNVRRDVPGGFPGDTHNEFTRAGRSDKQNEAYDFMSRLLQWRKTNEAVRRGTMKHFAPNNGVYVYTRYLKDAVEDIPVVVIMNGTSQPRTIDTSRYEEIITPGSVWEDVLTGETVTPVPEDEAPSMASLAAFEALTLTRTSTVCAYITLPVAGTYCTGVNDEKAKAKPFLYCVVRTP